MTESITPPELLDLTALTALEQAASRAPWQHEYEGSYIVHGDGHTIAEACYVAADAALIAAARNTLPALLAELEQTRAELVEARQTIAARGADIAHLERQVAAAVDLRKYVDEQRDRMAVTSPAAVPDDLDAYVASQHREGA